MPVIGYYISVVAGGMAVLVMGVLSADGPANISSVLFIFGVMILIAIPVSFIFLPLTLLALWILSRLQARRSRSFAAAGALVAPTSILGWILLREGPEKLSSIRGDTFPPMMIAGAVAGWTYWRLVVNDGRDVTKLPQKQRSPK